MHVMSNKSEMRELSDYKTNILCFYRIPIYRKNYDKIKGMLKTIE